jgi:hypothetical protein
MEQEGVVLLDRLRDDAERTGPVAFVLDEQRALALLDLGRDLLHELVGDADVVDAAAQEPRAPAAPPTTVPAG